MIYKFLPIKNCKECPNCVTGRTMRNDGTGALARDFVCSAVSGKVACYLKEKIHELIEAKRKFPTSATVERDISRLYGKIEGIKLMASKVEREVKIYAGG